MPHIYAIPASEASAFAPPKLVNLWAAGTEITVPSYAWRLTDTCFLMLFIVQTLLFIGLVCQDADLTVKLFNLKEGKWAGKVTNQVINGIGRNSLKEKIKEEILTELRIAIAREQRKCGSELSQH
ncbi:uncharacterized protein ALTATR162_LOCUS6490 [Alternaria atra]|uniref:Uncharacterized protein n=1 Tax=Alternaria atra TaxID=119953 RepID=A0A8J2I316_9PLEO|nr:uncharacterized protein ALTATR162_LOCUS6490 [Alternaria atra]CAG5163520.1 unnamed protein product [Alternaria atra]